MIESIKCEKKKKNPNYYAVFGVLSNFSTIPVVDDLTVLERKKKKENKPALVSVTFCQ